MTGKVISFEGLDKSGKHSAMDFASELLEQKGYSVYKLSFPQYDTPIGQLIRQYLTNQLELTPKAFELLLAADKVNGSDKLNELLTQYDFILIDRYVHSQVAYGLQNATFGYLSTLLSGVVLPDLVIYMDVDVAVSMSRQGEHGDNDKYESNAELLKAVKNNYDTMYRLKQDLFARVDANKSFESVNVQLTNIINNILNKD